MIRFLCCLIISVTAKYVELNPIRATGSLRITVSSDATSAVFYSRNNIEVLEYSDSVSGKVDVVLCDILCLPIGNCPLSSIINGALASSDAKVYGWSSLIVNRDNGIYDNLPYYLTKSTSKKKVFDSLSKYKESSPISCFLELIELELQCKLKQLVIESKDSSLEIFSR